MEPVILMYTFTPAEVERITGLSTGMQRDWRRREFLPASPKHARFDIFAVAEIFVLKLLSDRGVGPQQAKTEAKSCGEGIVWQSLQWEKAYAGDHQKTFVWEDCPGQWNRGLGSTWMRKADWLGRWVMLQNMSGAFVGSPRNFVWWANGASEFADLIDLAHTNNHDDLRFHGPIILLNLVALGGLLIQRAGRPFVDVRYPDLLSTT